MQCIDRAVKATWCSLDVSQHAGPADVKRTIMPDGPALVQTMEQGSGGGVDAMSKYATSHSVWNRN
jgi:hypothetical protein